MPDPITVDKILDEVSRTFNIPVSDILSKKKTADIAYARQVSMYIISQLILISSTEIGKHFNKDHTTVLYNIDKIKKIIKINETEKKLIDDIIKNIKA